MIVQQFPDHLRLYTQHDHGLATGAMAYHWREREVVESAMPSSLEMTIAMHDFAWFDEDTVPRWNASTGGIFDFQDLPSALKIPLYQEGIQLAARMDPWFGMLLSRHYGLFIPKDGHGEFHQSQSELRARLERDAKERGVRTDAVEQHFALLRGLDLLSLYSFLAQPGSAAANRPSWLPDYFPVGSERYELSWHDQDTLEIEDYPFARPFELTMPYRRLSQATYESSDELTRAWASAERATWTLRVRGR